MTIPSYGLLCKTHNNKIVFVKRKQTVEYVETICGNYIDHEMLKVFLYRLTNNEKNNLITKTFIELWNDLWQFHDNKVFSTHQKIKFEQNLNLIKRMIKEINKTNHDKVYADITLPKGRKNNKETTLEASIREFVEETGIPSNDFTVYKTHYIIEKFTGTNDKKYSTQYFFATMKRFYNYQNHFDKREVESVLFLTKKEALNLIDIRKPELRSVLMKIK